MASIFESLMSELRPQVVDPIASRLGEPPDAVRKGLQSGSAAMLGGIAAKADQPGFMGQIFNLIKNPASTSGDPSNVASATPGVNAPVGSVDTIAGSAPAGDLSSRFLSSIFGSGQSTVIDAIARSSGLAGNKASALLGMAAPLVLGFLGRHVRENGLSAENLANSLKVQMPELQRFLPSGFQSLLGGASKFAGAAPAAAATAASVAAVPLATAASRETRNRWIWPVVIIAAIIIFCIWFFSRAKAPMPEAAVPPPIAAPVADMPTGMHQLKLPDGVELNVPETGIENQLATFIASSKPVDKTTWFNFDRLVFDTGKTTLQPSSQEQLNNVAAILKAYPDVHVKVGGYTDNTGNAAANQKLSADRAKTVTDALEAAGIDKSRLESEGYGDQHPVASNSTAEGRAKNRRIALLVTKK
jgi:outer membrane protein OmpA-like peptidoglycan-associated protein